MKEAKYECKKCDKKCSLIIHDNDIPKTCPFLIIIPMWKFIYRVGTSDEIKEV